MNDLTNWDRLRAANAALIKAYSMMQHLDIGPHVKELINDQLSLLGRGKQFINDASVDLLFELDCLKEQRKGLIEVYPDAVKNNHFAMYISLMTDIKLHTMARVLRK